MYALLWLKIIDPMKVRIATDKNTIAQPENPSLENERNVVFFEVFLLDLLFVVICLYDSEGCTQRDSSQFSDLPPGNYIVHSNRRPRTICMIRHAACNRAAS